jgi:hypothetical protein
MENKANQIKIVVFLTFTILFGGLNFDLFAAAQETQRSRVFEKPTPTPKPHVHADTASDAGATPVPIQTVADLQSKFARLYRVPNCGAAASG